MLSNDRVLGRPIHLAIGVLFLLTCIATVGAIALNGHTARLGGHDLFDLWKVALPEGLVGVGIIARVRIAVAAGILMSWAMASFMIFGPLLSRSSNFPWDFRLVDMFFGLVMGMPGFLLLYFWKATERPAR